MHMTNAGNTHMDIDIAIGDFEHKHRILPISKRRLSHVHGMASARAAAVADCMSRTLSSTACERSLTIEDS
jgi:hypothetical protein